MTQSISNWSFLIKSQKDERRNENVEIEFEKSLSKEIKYRIYSIKKYLIYSFKCEWSIEKTSDQYECFVS